MNLILVISGLTSATDQDAAAATAAALMGAGLISFIIGAVCFLIVFIAVVIMPFAIFSRLGEILRTMKALHSIKVAEWNEHHPAAQIPVYKPVSKTVSKF